MSTSLIHYAQTPLVFKSYLYTTYIKFFPQNHNYMSGFKHFNI